MKIRIRLSVSGEVVREAAVKVDDLKFEELTGEEREQAVEVLVRSWADKELQIEWEAVQEA